MIYAEIMQTCILYIEIIHNITGRKNISDIQRPGLLGEETSDQRSFIKSSHSQMF